MVERKRLILPGFLSHDVCKELEFIHKSCSTVGYRPNVFSTTLSHLIATNCAPLIMPFVPIREKLKEKVEEFFDCFCDVCIEFTGLISWTKGASIGWHSDSNRPYLKQRHFAAVCYLNSYNKDFKGGLFHFQEGEPMTIGPKIGDAILYTADELNVHCVDEITEGERCTLTLWFTLDSSYNEDVKLIKQISNHFNPILTPDGVEYSNSDLPLFCTDLILDNWLPSPAPCNMYWVNENHLREEKMQENSVQPANQHLSFDIRWARVSLLGFEFSFDKSQGNLKECKTRMQEINYDCTSCSSDAFDQPVHLKWEGTELPEAFCNSLHAVQVIQFYNWKTQQQSSHYVQENYTYDSGEATSSGVSTDFKELQSQDYSSLRQILIEKFTVQDSTMSKFNVKLSYSPSFHVEKHQFNVENFRKVTDDWKHYLCQLWRALLISLPQWRDYEMLFPV